MTLGSVEATRGMLREFLRRFLVLASLVLLLVLAGTIGFLRYPGWSLSDALYMTVITLTAVGYLEVHPLTDGGRTLASVLLVGGITSMGLWFALITSSLVELDLAHVLKTRGMMKEIKKLKKHIVVCGVGRTGRQVVRELEAAGRSYVALDRDPARIEKLREEVPGALALVADATKDESLVEAGIGSASGLVSALNADADNVFVCLSARDLQPNLNIVARAYDEETMKKLYKAGADHVVSPNLTGGTHMASMLLRPQVMSFLDVATRSDGLSLRLEQVNIPETSSLVGRSLEEARIRQETGLVVIAIRRVGTRGDEGPLIYNPGPEESVNAEDVLIVMGGPEQVDQLRRVVAQ